MTTGFDWVHIPFLSPIESPVVISQIQTHTGADWVKTRHQSVTGTGFDIKMEEDGMDSGHNTEIFGFLALPAGLGSTGFLKYEAIATPTAVTHEPYQVDFTAGFETVPSVFGGMATYFGTDPSHTRLFRPATADSAMVYVEEETCTDAEVKPRCFFVQFS